MAKRGRAPVTLGFSVHTGWAAMIAVAGSAAAPLVVDRRRVEMIAGHDPEAPPFVYHAARRLDLPRAERFIRDAADEARAAATAAIGDAIAALAEWDVVAAGIVVGQPPRTAPSLAAILANHSAIHTAEGVLYRGAVAGACAARKLAVTEVRARELVAGAAALLDVTPAAVAVRLDEIGRAAGRPWAKDQKDAFVAALAAAAR
jgi:hypothetical protein